VPPDGLSRREDIAGEDPVLLDRKARKSKIFPFQPYPWFTPQGDSDTENARRSLLWLRSGVRELQEEDLFWPVGWQVDRPSRVVVRIIEAAAVFDATLWGTGCGEVKDEMDEGNAGKRIVDGDGVRRVGVTQFGPDGD
jgi:hypothetical protein